LTTNYTKITAVGIQKALENLKFLKLFDCCSSAQVLAKMHQRAFENKLPDIPKYQLIDLHCTNDSFIELPYKSGSLQTAVSLCSQLLRLRLVTQEGMTDADLLALVGLCNMQDFSIGAGEVCQVSFSNGILPLLQFFGKTLQTLTIAEFSNVNVRSIIEYCPELRSIDLFMNNNYDSYWVDGKRKAAVCPALKKLQSIQLVGTLHDDLEDDSVPEKHLSVLLLSSSLVHIYAKDCSTLTDNIFRKAHASHQFSNLQHLELERCHNFKPESAELLLNPSNPLKKLLLWQCRLISRQLVTKWSKIAEKKRWKLSLQWT